MMPFSMRFNHNTRSVYCLTHMASFLWDTGKQNSLKYDVEYTGI